MADSEPASNTEGEVAAEGCRKNECKKDKCCMTGCRKPCCFVKLLTLFLPLALLFMCPFAMSNCNRTPEATVIECPVDETTPDPVLVEPTTTEPTEVEKMEAKLETALRSLVIAENKIARMEAYSGENEEKTCNPQFRVVNEVGLCGLIPSYEYTLDGETWKAVE